MTYYQQKASEVRDLALAHPWGEGEQRALEDVLKEIARDQRHACARVIPLDTPEYVEIAVMNAALEEE